MTNSPWEVCSDNVATSLSSGLSRESTKFPVLCVFLETWRPASAAVLSGVFGCEVSLRNRVQRYPWEQDAGGRISQAHGGPGVTLHHSRGVCFWQDGMTAERRTYRWIWAEVSRGFITSPWNRLLFKMDVRLPCRLWTRKANLASRRSSRDVDIAAVISSRSPSVSSNNITILAIPQGCS